VLSVTEKRIDQHCPQCRCRGVMNGKSKTGIQRYLCKNCGRNFQETYYYKAYFRGVNIWISSLIKESCGVRSISRLLGISPTTVIARIKAVGKSLIRPHPILKGKEYEIDEMRTYIANKKRLYWIVYAIRKDTREVVDYAVGKRTMKTLKRIVDTLLLSEAKKIYTDGYDLYRTLIPKEIHYRSKYNINHIERKNLSIRTHLKRLSRKTICFSKSKVMLENCLRIYFWNMNYTNHCVEIETFLA
jgi:insertion element IS1 protein InsB